MSYIKGKVFKINSDFEKEIAKYFKTMYNLETNQLQHLNQEQNFLLKEDVCLDLNAFEEKNNKLKNQTEKRYFNRGKINVLSDNYFGQNSQGFNNLYQRQYDDTYRKAIFNKEKIRYKGRNRNQNSDLSMYLVSNDNLYKYRTERLIYCECCGKAKKPKECQRESNIQQARKFISREIIAEERTQGDYVIKYNNKVDLIQTIPSKIEGQIQGNDNLYGLEENYSSLKEDYCPNNGYI